MTQLSFDGFSSVPFGIRRAGDSTLVEVGYSGSQNKSHRQSDSNDDGDMVIPSKKVKLRQQVRAGASLQSRFGLKDGLTGEGSLGLTSGTDASQKDRYIYELRMLLEGRKIYPRLAKHMKETGKVLVRFRILQDGQIENIELVKSSMFTSLNEAAISLVAGIKQYKPLPHDISGQVLTLEVPIEYQLNDAL